MLVDDDIDEGAPRDNIYRLELEASQEASESLSVNFLVLYSAQETRNAASKRLLTAMRSRGRSLMPTAVFSSLFLIGNYIDSSVDGMHLLRISTHGLLSYCYTWTQSQQATFFIIYIHRLSSV